MNKLIFSIYLKRVLFSTVFILGIAMLDMSLTRGYFLSKIIAPYHINGLDEWDANMTYSIKEFGEKKYLLEIRNNSFLPKQLVVYRNNEVFHELSNDVFFAHAMRSKLRFNAHNKRDSGAGFDCGTGLGVIIIKPFETFSCERTYDELLSAFYDFSLLLGLREGHLYNLRNLKPVNLKDSNLEEELIATSTLTKQDSVVVNFYLPVNSIFTGKQQNIYANAIQLSYIDLLVALKENQAY